MNLESVLLAFVLLFGWCFRLVSGDFVASDEHYDVEHHKEAQQNPLTEAKQDEVDLNTRTRRDSPDTTLETVWNVPDMGKGNYEDADWHPSSSIHETLSVLSPDAPLDISSDNNEVDNFNNQTLNHATDGSPAQCGEYSSQVTPAGHCRLMASLPSVGTTQKRCPDMFRCTDDISFWLHENQNRKEQLKELRETMSELQEELRNHRHRVKALEMQVDKMKPLIAFKGKCL